MEGPGVHLLRTPQVTNGDTEAQSRQGASPISHSKSEMGQNQSPFSLLGDTTPPRPQAAISTRVRGTALGDSQEWPHLILQQPV